MKHPTFLVATDFSKTGMTVVRKALEIAQSHQADLHIVHIIDAPWYTVRQETEAIREHSWKALSNTFSTLQKNNFHCLGGNIVSKIFETAERIGATLLIIGSSGENYLFKDFLVGSTTKNIIRNTTLPILVIKNNEPLNPQRILIPTDLSENSKTTIHNTAELFPEAKILMLSFFDVPFEGRLSFYGFNGSDIMNYQMQIRKNHEISTQAFSSTLALNEEKAQMITQKGPLSPQLFLEVSNSLEINMVSIHTSGDFSFFALELLEESHHDVLIFKF